MSLDRQISAFSANFGNLADDAEVALDVVAVLFPPSAPFDVAAGVLIELAAYWAPFIHITADPNPIVDAQTTLTEFANSRGKIAVTFLASRDAIARFRGQGRLRE